jgi:hypothetical protein
MRNENYFMKKRVTRFTTVVLSSILMSACMMQTTTSYEGIGYRETRFAQISAMRDYRKCRDEALVLDNQARLGSGPARYIASAQLIEKCEAELGPNTSKVANEERMRAYALSIQNYFKGGDMVKARKNLENLKNKFPDNDLYLADGSSFIQTMEVLLSLKPASTSYDLALSNVNEELKSEIKRSNYWNKN